MNVLHISADPRPVESSVPKEIAVAFFNKLSGAESDIEITHVDLYKDPPPYMSEASYRGQWYPVFIEGYQATREEVAANVYGQKQSELFNQTDALVIATPMWNFSVPAILKGWIDCVLAPGLTYTFEKTGPQPLHRIKKVVLLVASDDTFKEEDPRDILTAQIRASLEYIEIEDLSVAWADGQNPVIFGDCELRKSMAIEAAEELAEELVEMESVTN
ncbi:MAG: hypothetical protein GKR87_13995 [Kiritimatiellae bacterium]|nr:hypothetical protein [Kiritimatiellia bacterium]